MPLVDEESDADGRENMVSIFKSYESFFEKIIRFPLKIQETILVDFEGQKKSGLKNRSKWNFQLLY